MTTLTGVGLKLLAHTKIEKDLEVDFSGHFGTRQKDFRNRLALLWGWSFLHTLEDLGDGLVQKFVDGEHINPIEMKMGVGFDQCGECGERLHGVFDGKTLKLVGKSGTPCPHPHGLPEFCFEINIPSGRMVVTDELREYFQEAEKVEGPSADMETNIGVKYIALCYAQFGLAHAFVGNTSPNLYRHAPDKFSITHAGTAVPEGELVARIVTDLWWYSIADEADLQKRGYKNKKGRSADPVIDVPPGRYRFTHRYHLCDRNDFVNSQVYATVERISDCT